MCKLCRNYGYVKVYNAPHVVRECCKCEIGQKKKEFIESLVKRDNPPVWELFSL